MNGMEMCGEVYGVVWCGVVWRCVEKCMVWCGVLWYGDVWRSVWCGVLWCGMEMCGEVYGVVCCGVLWCGVVLCWCCVVWCVYLGGEGGVVGGQQIVLFVFLQNIQNLMIGVRGRGGGTRCNEGD